MNPKICQGLATRSLGLGNLILMVREYQILAPAMDIEGITK